MEISRGEFDQNLNKIV